MSAVVAGIPSAHRAQVDSSRKWADTGSVTVEAALGICSIVAVFALLLVGAATVVDQIRCTDAAIEAARLAARGDHGRAAEAATRIAPAGANLSVSVHGDEITAEVRAPPPGGLLPSRWLVARAVAVVEPGTTAPREG